MTERVRKHGVVTTRTCPTCGHHEVGITTDEGSFASLEPGQRIWLLEEPEDEQCKAFEKGISAPDSGVPGGGPTPRHAEQLAWAPAPLMTIHTLRQAFGVLSPEADPPDRTPEAYKAAYLAKLGDLIAREDVGTRAMLLDRHFAAPHIATGFAEEIAWSLWVEWEQIRAPALLVASWLDGEEKDLLGKARAIFGRLEEAEGPVPDQEAFRRELQSLSLEIFLNWIA